GRIIRSRFARTRSAQRWPTIAWCRVGSAPPCRLDRGHVDLLHRHHRLEGAPGFVAASRHGLGEHTWRDLPREAPLVLAPAALALLPAIADDGVPVAVGFLLILGHHLEAEGLAVLEGGAAVQAEA